MTNANSPGQGKNRGSITGWPGWARVLVSLVLLYHGAAVIAGALGVPPSSELERKIANLFTPYHDLVDQGYAYRYYAEPPPTPVITAKLHFGDGRPEQTIRLPGTFSCRAENEASTAARAWPMPCSRMFSEAQRNTADSDRSLLAAAFARHLCAANPGCVSVTLYAQQHLIPDPIVVREAMADPGAGSFDLFDDRFFTTPQWIGDFACDGS